MSTSALFRTAALLLTLAAAVPALGVHESNAGPKDTDNIVPKDLVIPPAPHLSVAESLKSFRIEKGFRISNCVAEPAVVKPVQIAFDEDGRMWVVEMRGYMPDVDGTGEDIPKGRVSVHEDKDGDGVYETHSVFMDNLLLPRAIAFGMGGVLVAEHAKLLWIPQKDGKPAGAPRVVDAKYASGGNVEHRSSGLVQGLDGAYYSTYTDKAYVQTKDGFGTLPWNKRGQFGMSQDAFGRLVVNGNPLPAEIYLMPPFFQGRSAAAQVGLPTAKTDTAVFPIRVTPGTNRAYDPSPTGDVSHKTWMLQRATACSGPLCYTGGLPEFKDTMFAHEPAGNLVMRYGMQAARAKDGMDTVKFANPGRAFLASTDERFRPVNAAVGPDGCVYLVDFDSGIIQHKTYLSHYNIAQIKSRNLEDEGPGAGYGRVWRIAPESMPVPARRPRMSGETAAQLVEHLADPNKWWRDTAQRLLVERNDPAALAPLAAMARHPSPVARAHALWTLKRLGALDAKTLGAAFDPAKAGEPEMGALGLTCARLLADFQGGDQAKAAGSVLDGWVKSAKNPSTGLTGAFAFAAAALGKDAAPGAFAAALASKSGFVRGYFVAGAAGREAALLAALPKNAPAELAKALAAAAKKRAALKDAPAPGAPAPLELKPFDPKEVEVFAPGEKSFTEICGACHGGQGEGQPGIAPPFAGSEWVNGPKSQLITAVFNGIQGPIDVAGQRYVLPGTMPGFLDNPMMTDEELASLLTYIRSHFGNQSSPVTPEEVAAIRKNLPSPPVMMTPEQVRALPLGEGEKPAEVVALPVSVPGGPMIAVFGISVVALWSLLGAVVCWKMRKLP